MRIVGISELLRRTQEYVRDDPAWRDILGEDRRGTLILYEFVVPDGQEVWRGYYMPWAKVSPIEMGSSLFILSYHRQRKWQDLEVTGHLEECLQAIKENVYGVFFYATTKGEDS
jgi:hypothetical protein